MKIIREDNRPGGLRVIERFAYYPMKIICIGHPNKWVFLKKYYELQRLSYWHLYWMDGEKSMNKNEWDFKWSETYLNLWK